MQATPKPASRTRALIGLTLLVCVLLFLLALIEGPDSQLGCSPIAPASANPAEPTSLEPPPSELDDPGTKAQTRPSQQAVPLTQMLHGRVLDEATDEPIPFVLVHVSSEAGSDTARTNAQGSFVTTIAVTSGSLTADVTDDGESVGTARAQWPPSNGASEWTIRVPIGPTFPLTMIKAPVENWRMHLVESQYPRGTAGVILVSFDKLAPEHKGELRDWGWKSVRFEDGHLFVRWPRLMFPADRAWFPSIHVRNDSASAKADVSVYGTVGIQSPLSFQTNQFAVLRGNVTASRGTPSAATHVVACDPIDDDKTTFQSVPFFAEIVTSDDGAYSFEVPASRTYRLDAWHPGLTMDEQLAVVGRGPSNGPELRLRPPDKKRTQPVLVFQYQGRSESSGSLLRIVPSAVFSYTDALVFDGEIREFDLSGLALGPYRVENIGIDEATHLSSIRRSQQMPVRELDPPPKDTPRACIHRIDAGVPGMYGRCTLAAGPAGSLFTSTKRDSSFTWTLPPDNPAIFTVWCEGFSPALITEGRFEKHDEELVATTTLSPGWGALLAFRAGDPNDLAQARGKLTPRSRLSAIDAYGFTVPPLPGVRVEFAGAPLGSSDRDGCVLVSQMLQPQRLTLVALGWHMMGMTRMPGAGSRWWVWMSRDP